MSFHECLIYNLLTGANKSLLSIDYFVMEYQNKPSVARLRSIDALSGFDMFWIIYGSGEYLLIKV